MSQFVDLRPVAVNNMMKDKNVESSVTKLELDVEKILKAIAKLKPDKSQIKAQTNYHQNV